MSINSDKEIQKQDFEQAIRYAYNNVDKTISVNGFIVGKIGHKVTMTIATTSVANDTEQFDFTDDGNLMYTIKVVYTDGTRDQFLSAERTA